MSYEIHLTLSEWELLVDFANLAASSSITAKRIHQKLLDAREWERDQRKRERVWLSRCRTNRPGDWWCWLPKGHDGRCHYRRGDR